MRNLDSRYQAAQRWFQRGTAEKNPFDAFFCLWIALIVAARYGVQRGPEASDLKTIRDYFDLNRDRVLLALNQEDEIVRKLRGRRGTEGGKIVEVYGPGRELRRERFDRFASAYDELSDDEKVKTVAEIVNQVRNNLFHGRKLYDDRQDRELLELVNPLIASIIENAGGFQR